MNTWYTVTESYQQRVYNNTLPIVKRQTQQAENPTPAVVNSADAPRGDNAIPLDYLPSEVSLQEPEITSTEPNIAIDNHCTDDELHFKMAGGSRDWEEDGDESDECDAIRTASWQRQPATELQRFDLATINVDRYEAKDGDDADADSDGEDKASQADDGSTENLED
jgi:hypothetical protein